MTDFKETILFSSTDTEGRVNMQSIEGDAINLFQLSQLFKDFLLANGYNYVESVTINKPAGNITSEH